MGDVVSIAVPANAASIGGSTSAFNGVDPKTACALCAVSTFELHGRRIMVGESVAVYVIENALLLGLDVLRKGMEDCEHHGSWYRRQHERYQQLWPKAQ